MMMDSVDVWTQFFGWYTALNVGIYLITAVAVLTMRNLIVRQGTRWFGVSEEDTLRTTYQWIGAYKLGILLFALVPWLALKLMA